MAQAHVQLPAATGEPSKRLVGWSNVTLEPGQAKHVEITLSPRDLDDLHLLQYWDGASGAWVTASGTYTVSVGGSFDTALGDSIEIHNTD